MSWGDENTEALVEVLENYGYTGEYPSDSYSQAKSMVSNVVSDYFISQEFMSKNIEGMAHNLRGGEEPEDPEESEESEEEEEAEDIWEWLEENFYDHQSDETKDKLHEYFELIRADIANTVAYGVPDQILANISGEDVDNITPEWREGIYAQVFMSLIEFDFVELTEEFTELKVELLEDHFAQEA